MNSFITILAWAFGALCILRVVGIYYGAKEYAGLIRFAEALGGNPVGDALKWPVIIFIICVAWLVR